MVRNRDGSSYSLFSALHDDVAATLAYFEEAVAFEDTADFLTGENL
jgi:hypothetical protein